MKPGSVVVDLAAESGGNVEGVVAGQGRPDRRRPGLGRRRTCPAQMPGPASPALRPEHRQHRDADDARDGRGFAPDFEDEIVAGSCVTHDGDDPARADPQRPGGPTGERTA